MNVEQFFHVCRSAAALANTDEITVFGAAAIVPWVTDVAGAAPWPSLEVDIDPGSTAAADLVDGSIGEGSLFADTFGVHAHGLGLEAFVAPPDWVRRARVFREPVSGVRVRTPHPLDLTIAKLVRGDPRDWDFARYAAKHFGLSTTAIVEGLRAAGAAKPAYARAVEAASAAALSRL